MILNLIFFFLKRVVAENVNDYFYKCYVCKIGFKRRGMLVNHINLFHPDISLDSIPELNAPILKAYCDFYCPYCDKVGKRLTFAFQNFERVTVATILFIQVYKSSTKRKLHMMKSHPGAKIPPKREWVSFKKNYLFISLSIDTCGGIEILDMGDLVVGRTESAASSIFNQ